MNFVISCLLFIYGLGCGYFVIAFMLVRRNGCLVFITIVVGIVVGIFVMFVVVRLMGVLLLGIFIYFSMMHHLSIIPEFPA